MAADKFPRAYRNSVPQDLDDPDPMVHRVPFTHTEVGARKSVVRSVKDDNPFSIEHVPSQHSH
jgi:hypothetical protein